MKRLLTTAAILASVSAFAFMPHPMPMHLPLNALDLTTAQKEKLRTIQREARNEHLKLMDQMEDLRDKTDERMMNVLTDAQRKQWKEVHRTRSAKARNNAPCDISERYRASVPKGGSSSR